MHVSGNNTSSVSGIQAGKPTWSHTLLHLRTPQCHVIIHPVTVPLTGDAGNVTYALHYTGIRAQ